MTERVFVIVGASLAGVRAAQTLREEGFDGRIVLIGMEDHLPYERPPLSKGYLLGKEERGKAFPHDETWYADQRIDLRRGARVTAVDPAAHRVTIEGGEQVGYDKLLLATGSSVRTLDLPGAEGPKIHHLRTIEQSEALGATLRAGGPLMVIGAGWIGLEAAAAARHFGCDVTVVESDRTPLRHVLGDEVGEVFRDLHAAHGVDFRFDTQVREFGGIGDRITHAVLDDNTEVPASAALVAVGITPNVELARAAGLRVDDGVVTDAALRTSDPDIYACGDVASAYHPLVHQHVRVEHWANALNGGPAAARSMLGQEVSYDRLPYFFTDQYDLGMELAGWFPRGGYDRVVFRGDPSIVDGKAPEFLAFWTRRAHVLAGMNVNVWDVQDDIQKLVRGGYTGKDVDLDALADPTVPLATLLAG